MKKTPYKATIRSYQVGFGDCFLLTFHYKTTGTDDDERHVLIDCGSTAPPKAFLTAKKAFSLLPVAEEIKSVCNGKLTAVVATHRHKDHISGFATAKNGKASGDVLRSLKPDLVLQPWTEDPDLPKDATSGSGGAGSGQRPASSKKFALGLQGINHFSAGLLKEIGHLGEALGKGLKEQLRFLGDDNLSNAPAVNNLMTMGKNEYLCYGQKTTLEKLLPGVTVTVLGPPTLEQNKGIAKQRSTDSAEFWQLKGAAAAGYVGSGGKSPFSVKYHQNTDPETHPELRWILPRIRASRGAQLLELVRILDDQMNNTSLILLFQANGKKLLFPGDAQIENWNHALKDAKHADKNREMLAGTDLYKVGHHGSLNATPKTLWNLFDKKGSPKKNTSLKTMMSTRAGKHGSRDRNTEVPRTTLVEALSAKSQLTTTEDLKGTKAVCNTVEIDL